MKMIVGGLSNKTRIGAVCMTLLLLASVLTLATVAYQKSRQGGADTGSYLYQVYGEQSGETEKGDKQDSTHTVLVLGKDFDSNRTDAIICVAFKGDGSISTLQIPRDTYAEDGDYKGRINGLLPRYRAEAMDKGDTDPTHSAIHKLMEKLRSDLGIKCDSYLFMDSKAVAAVTDALGGVTVEIPADIDYTDKDREIDLHLKAGRQSLDGATASQFVRYRQGYLQSDMGRLNAQKLFVAALLDKLQNTSSLSTAVSLAAAMADYIKTDLNAEDITKLTASLCMAKPEEVLMYTLPGDGVKLGSGSYYGVFADKLCEILEKGFDIKAEPNGLTVQSFSGSGGYRDTEGVSLATLLEKGMAIPVYSDKK